MKSFKHLFSPILAATLAAVILVGCGKPSGADHKGTIRLAYVNWAEGVAVAHLLDAILGDIGYEVETTMADVAPVYASVSDGRQDVIVEAWLPTTHKYYMAEYGDNLEVASTWYENTGLGLVVPDYVEIDSLEQMSEHAEKFKSRIIGIDAGAAVMGITATAIKEYKLDGFELVASSGPAMTAALKAAIDKKEWIAVTGWTPHWKFSRYKLKFLKDPKKLYGDPELIQSLCRKGFSDDYPEVAAILKRMKFDMHQIGSLMDVMEHTSLNPEKAIREWISENQELVDSWMSE